MYIIAKGECVVQFMSEKRKPIKNKKYLRIGEYFGEISLLYGCKRSATVLSTKYSSLALLTKEKFKEIATEYPDLVNILKDGIFKYNDRMKRFVTHMIDRVDYF